MTVCEERSVSERKAMRKGLSNHSLSEVHCLQARDKGLRERAEQRRRRLLGVQSQQVQAKPS